jgi:hypothetical protein
MNMMIGTELKHYHDRRVGEWAHEYQNCKRLDTLILIQVKALIHRGRTWFSSNVESVPDSGNSRLMTPSAQV